VAAIVDLVAADLAVDAEAVAAVDTEAGAAVFLVETLFLAGVAEEAEEAVVLSDVFVILYDV
jgi:hypothetical protein